MSLFPDPPSPPRRDAPLADRMRPRSLDEVVGQEKAIGRGSALFRAVEAKSLPSLILWGPPGVGKTTIARLLAAEAGYRFVPMSAVSAGIKEIREAVVQAGRERERTLLFVDEIHRFHKGQQDALLPHVEDGLLTLVGATTENPSFEVNSALLSRCRVVSLAPLPDGALEAILRRALSDRSRGTPAGIEVEEEAVAAFVRVAAGDARRALNLLELAVTAARTEARGSNAPPRVTVAQVVELAKGSPLLYDKAGEEHYNLASALIKSLRASDPDAAIYWTARMLESGEDPMFVARRLMIFASEDVGLADPQALLVAVAAAQATHLCGMPEARLMLSQAVLHLATAPKSNTALEAYQAAAADVAEKGALPTPLHFRNAPTPLLKQMGYGKGYDYPHDHGGVTEQRGLPEELKDRRYFHPGGKDR